MNALMMAWRPRTKQKAVDEQTRRAVGDQTGVWVFLHF